MSRNAAPINEDEPVFDDEESSDEPLLLLHGEGDAEAVWLVVGDDQARAAADCHPEGVAVHRVDESVLVGSAPPEGLEVVEDRKVLVFPLGDAASEVAVYEQAAEFGRLCSEEGADEVRFAWLSRDLDSYLGDRDPEEKRKRLGRLVKKRTGLKPAKAKPKPPSKTEARLHEVESRALEEGRRVINVTGDRLTVVNDLVEALKEGPDGERLYDFGGRIAQIVTNRKTGALQTEIVAEEQMLTLLPRSAKTVSVGARAVTDMWPETKTLTALYGRHREFRPLSGVARTPIVRADHTIAAEDGYDPESQMLLDLGGIDLDIPDDPSEEQVAEAVRLLLDEWLGDFPFASQADRANVLALVLSYPLRLLLGLIPLAVISAKAKGTGKSKLISLIVLLFTRAMPALDSLPSSEEEIRKQITTWLREAPQFLIYDESPRIGGKSINRKLTSTVWSDRVLGGSERAVLPNNSVDVATGNNVEVLGDTSRRYYPIELTYDGESPETRSESEFRHPDLEAWTEENRGELLTAVFTLIRAWQVAGRPKRTSSFGSFERWESTIGGVLENAGVPGFLDNLAEHRAEADYDEGLWRAHCDWWRRTVTESEPTVRDIVKKMIRQTGNGLKIVDPDADLPPGIDVPPTDPGYAAKLGRLYHQRAGGWSGGYRIVKSARKAGANKTRWILQVSDRLKQEEAEAEAAEKAAERAQERQQRISDLPGLKASYEQLKAARGEGEESPQERLLRLEIRNAELLREQNTTTEGAAV